MKMYREFIIVVSLIGTILPFFSRNIFQDIQELFFYFTFFASLIIFSNFLDSEKEND